MYFDLTDEQKMISDTLGSLLKGHIDGTGIIHQIDDSTLIDQPLWQQTSEMGLNALLVPEEHGGMGMDLLTLTVVAEAMGYSGAISPLVFHNLATFIVAGAEASIRDTCLPSLIEGSAMATLALNEGDRQWQPDSWTLTGATLTGTKTDVVAGAIADLFVVALKDGQLALVDKNAPGVTVTSPISVDRTRALASVTFDDTPYQLLSTDAGVADRLLQALKVTLAADAYGAGKKGLDLAVDYANTREQFGRLIGSFQGLKYQLANMAVDMEPCRALCWYAAHAWDRIPAEAPAAASRAKAHTTGLATRTCRMAVEAHGGIGYTWEYPLHIWLKRAMFDYAYLGNPTTERQTLASVLNW